ncbi:MAG TPA: tetratricopeptide repeat protein [Thermoanaerobaculia bacterium]|nr:tetratricopeptide repeat protein [Thermoanaerobaculia bacterium]
MANPGGRSEARTALDHLCTWHLRGATGTLTLEIGDRSRRFHLVEGQLHLPGANPVTARLRELPAASASAEVRERWIGLLQRVAESLDEGRVRFADFRAGHSALPPDLGAALPTVTLLRTGYQLRERAISKSGSTTMPVNVRLIGSSAERWAPDALGWSPEELWILERLRAPMSLEELERGCPFARERLREAAAGLIALERIQSPSAGPESSRVAIAELAERFAERIGASLVERPLVVPADEYRRRIADLLARAGELGHVELLGVAPDARAESVQDAFEELGRWVHPSNAARFGVGDRVEALRFLFERATEAYRTLSDPQLRMAYLGTRQGGFSAPSMDAGERASEARQLARQLFERAVYEESIEEIHIALQLLEQAVRTDPRAEYWSALGRLQARNAAWTGRAIESYKSALELDPHSGEVRYALGRLYEQAGDLDRARVHYQSAAAGRPPHAGARDALARLAAEKNEGGAFSRLFRRE